MATMNARVCAMTSAQARGARAERRVRVDGCRARAAPAARARGFSVAARAVAEPETFEYQAEVRKVSRFHFVRVDARAPG